MTKELVERDDKGRFLPGQSGNPEGKAKGIKNYITHERLMLESALRDFVGQPEQAKLLTDGIARILKIANFGDDKDAISAMKLLLDRVMPSMPLKEAAEEERTDRRLEIIIVTNPNAKVPVQPYIEGALEQIEETPCQTLTQDSPQTPSKAAKAPTPSTTKGGTRSRKTSARKSAKAKRRNPQTKRELSK